MQLRLRFTCFIIAVAAAATTHAQLARLPLVNNARLVVTPDELGCVAYDPKVPGTYAAATAQKNARLLQEAGQSMAQHQRAIMIPIGRWYVVADYDGDGADIHWQKVTGMTVGMAGGLDTWRFHSDLAWQMPANSSGGLIHGGKVGVDGDVVLKLTDFQYCQLALNIRGSLAHSKAEADAQFNRSDPEKHRLTPCALVLANRDNQSTSGEANITLGATQCYRAIEMIWEAGSGGPDTMNFQDLALRYCHYGVRVVGAQNIDFDFGRIKNSGSPMVRCLEFIMTNRDSDRTKAGGVLRVENFFLCPGLNLFIQSPTTSSRFDIHVRGDGYVVDAPTFQLLDTALPTSQASVRVTGSFSRPAQQKVVHVSNDATGAHDVQIDVMNLGDEEGAYPMRPTRGQWVARRHEPPIFDSTQFCFNADRDKPWGEYLDPDWEIGAGGTIEQAADIAAGGNVLKPQGTPPVIARGAVNCRDAVRFAGGRLVVPAQERKRIGAAYSDLTIACVVKPLRPRAGVFFACTNRDGSGGCLVGMNESRQALCRFGNGLGRTADAFVATNIPPLELDRTNLVIARREAATGTWSLLVNGEVATVNANATGEIPAVNGAAVLGSAQSAANPGWGYFFIGYVSQVIVDDAIVPWPARQDPKGDSRGRSRQLYLRQYGVY